MSVKLDSKLCKGGLALTTPALAADPGSAAELLNFEVDIAGGFKRIDGYERFDGQTPPSSGWSDEWEWNLVDVGTSPDGYQWEAVAPVVGNLNEAVTLCIPLNGLSLIGGLTMAPGGEFALLVHDGNQAHYTEQVYVSQQDFLDAIEAMPGVASAVVADGSLCITSDVPMIPGVYPRLEVLQWIVQDDTLTEETLREAISGPPGFGPIYGLTTFKGVAICCRDFDELGTDSRIYRSTPSGWEQIPMPVAARIGSAVYNFAEYNFFGDPARRALYGADGKNKAFEIKGNPSPGVMEYTEIDTTITRGLVTYYPQRVAAHSNHLFLSFDGGWVQYSGIGNPFSDDPNDGAGGVAYPGDITNMLPLKDNAMAITTRTNMFILYGTSEPDWQSTSQSAQGDGVGALPDTLVSAAGTYFCEPGGLFRMDSVSTFGNFVTAALSRGINPLYQFLSPTIMGAAAIKQKGIYRLYCRGGEWISMTFGPESILGFGYGRIPINPHVLGYGTIGSTPEDQREVILNGDDVGMVYMMDRGDTFDGADIPAAIRFHFHNGGNPRQVKRWRKAVFEINAPALFEMHSNAVFDYGGTEEAALHNVDLANLTQSGGVWNLDHWNEFFWLGKYVGEGEMRIDGHARNVSLLLFCEGRIPSFLIEGYTVHYSPRRLAR